MTIVFEDIHGNKREEEMVLGSGDKLIVRYSKETSLKQLEDFTRSLSKFMSAGQGVAITVPHYIEFVVMKVTT